MALVIDDVLECAANVAPRRVAATLLDDAITFAALRERSHRLANALTGLRIGRRARVAYWADIHLDALPLAFALGRVGAAFAPMNPAYGDEEARGVLEYLAPHLLVTDGGHAERAEVLAKELDIPLATLGARGPGAALDELAGEASPSSPSVPQPHEEDIFTIFLTSGSTGKPKGAMISHRATWLRVFAGTRPEVTSGKGDVVMFPLFHMAGWFFASMAWSAHAPAHFVPRADPDLLMDAIQRHGAGTLYCIPAVWQRILDDRRPHDASSLEWALIGTSRVELELLQALKDRFPWTRSTVAYGSTEAGRAIWLPDADLFRKPGSVGIPVPGMRAALADDGELLLSSNTLMTGYYDLPEETAAVLRDGWYHSGDVAERDDDGYWSITGRTKEMIRSGGEWVAPVEVEAVLADYPGLAEVAVVGVPDPRWGEVVCAAVVMADGAPPPTVDALRGHIGSRLAPFKHPRQVLVVDALPRTPATGQIQRSRLARQAVGS